jgi:hypothetical protein
MVKVSDLKDKYDGNVMLYCECCSSECSATRGDYFQRPLDHTFTCCGEPMRLVRKRVMYEDVLPECVECDGECMYPDNKHPQDLHAGDRVRVRARHATGLTYPAFSGILLEDAGTSEGWDVVDVRNENGVDVSVYCFSIIRD